ncbi:GIP [Symbiodinium natans]|uniref:GIP protein n=1 Tax=Symbiodinium natans TaxID=878477 RepID=A0A812VGJ0_9DINO|nr:GIP [Symbiodinium natans]
MTVGDVHGGPMTVGNVHWGSMTEVSRSLRHIDLPAGQPVGVQVTFVNTATVASCDSLKELLDSLYLEQLLNRPRPANRTEYGWQAVLVGIHTAFQKKLETLHTVEQVWCFGNTCLKDQGLKENFVDLGIDRVCEEAIPFAKQLRFVQAEQEGPNFERELGLIEQLLAEDSRPTFKRALQSSPSVIDLCETQPAKFQRSLVPQTEAVDLESELRVDPGQGVHLPQGAQATTAAATAAQAALSAATSQGNAKQGIAGSDMARILPKPDVFKPATREEEHGMWLQWFWSLKQYLCALDSAFGDEIAYLEQHPDEEGQGYKSPEAAQRSKQLFALLCSLVKGRGLQLIQRVPAQSGFEALRQLIQLFQPTSRTRSLGILSAITSMNHFKGNEPLLPQVLDMERIFEEYERSSGKKLDDDFKTSIFLRSITQSMRNHLATILTEDVTYDALREAALRFERMNAKWDARNLFAGDSLFANRRQPAGPNDGPVPMEGRGDKGQKGNPKGPDAGKGARQNVICHACGKRGHYKSECWQNVQHVQGDDASTTAPSTAGPSASQVRPSPDTSTTMRSVNMVQIDVTGDWCGGSINALTADSCPAAGDDFLKVVKSLALIPHRYPSLPNLVPVQENDLIAIAEPECTVFAQAIAEPECTVFAQQCGVEVYDMSATDGDEDWTVCDGVLPATATTEVTSGVYARRDMSDCLLDCTVPLTHLGVQFRTTLRQEASGWAVFELNTPLSSLDLSEASFVPSRIHNIITIGSCSKINIDELFGRVPPARRDHVSEDAESDAGLPDVPIGGVGNIAGPDDEIQEGDELPGQEAEEVMQPAMRAHVVVEGVELHEGCTLSTLRAACTALGIGKSGGKATVLQRIHNFMDRQRLLERHQVEDARVQLPREQAPVSEPTPEEVRRHALSHIPFMPWCEHCIKFQARADRHVQARPDVRACSTCSFDFAFTERETGRPGDKLICLILKDSHTGATCAIPTPAKGGTVAFKFMVAEVCKFLNFCGHTEIALRSDGEPACLALQQGVKELRSRMKLDTHLEQLEAADHQANPSEQTVDQLRQLTGTLLSQVEAETGQKVSTMSPLHAWAWKHACWLQMRYGRSGFASPFEVITGRPYNGKVVGFGEVVFARIKSSIKGKARWIKMLWLGKLGVSDLHVGVTPGGFLISSRSVRRLPKQYDASLLESLRDMPWSQASFLAGQVGQARMQRTPVRGEEEEVQQPLPEVVLPERPPLPYPGYVLPDNAPLEELIPPPAIIASGTPEPPTPVQTSAETPLPTAAEPSTPMLVDSDAPPPQQEASGARASSGLGGVSGSSEALGAPGPAPEARPSGAGGDEQPAPKRARIRLRLDAVQVDKDGNELHNVDEQIELFDEAAEGFMDCEESEAWDNYDDDAGASPSAEIPSAMPLACPARETCRAVASSALRTCLDH